jgi:hypothetical protein
MNCVSVGNHKLYFITINDNVFKEREYKVLINTSFEKDFNKGKEKFEHLLGKNCKEIYCIGPFAEKLHDILDELIEDNEYFETITTYETCKPMRDICYYFFKLAGGGDSLNMYVLANQEEEFEIELKKYFQEMFS